jgi:hypothetical protein
VEGGNRIFGFVGFGKMSMELVGAGYGGEHASADGVRNKVCFVRYVCVGLIMWSAGRNWHG